MEELLLNKMTSLHIEYGYHIDFKDIEMFKPLLTQYKFINDFILSDVINSNEAMSSAHLVFNLRYFKDHLQSVNQMIGELSKNDMLINTNRNSAVVSRVRVYLKAMLAKQEHIHIVAAMVATKIWFEVVINAFNEIIDSELKSVPLKISSQELFEQQNQQIVNKLEWLSKSPDSDVIVDLVNYMGVFSFYLIDLISEIKSNY